MVVKCHWLLPAPVLIASLLVAPSSADARRWALGPEPIAVEEPAAPWQPRVEREAPSDHPRGMTLLAPERWPAEPASPENVDPTPFTQALRTLCGPALKPRAAARLANWLLSSSRDFGVDPFVLAALVYDESGCVAKRRHGRVQPLIRLNYQTHRPFVHDGAYHFYELKDGDWQADAIPLGELVERPRRADKSQLVIHFAAAVLSAYRRQCPAIDSRFGSIPHRHPVSHLVQGDAVHDDGTEDRILLARRRLIGYYQPAPCKPVSELYGVPLCLPLDGELRKITSGIGDLRAGGRRAHRGVDFESVAGEPVYAVADGVVIRAGLDLPGRGSRPIAPERSRRYRYVRRAGPGGIFVMIQHDAGVVSAYMHLDHYSVKDGDRVKQGQQIGVVGRSGIRHGAAHLHFELRDVARRLNPVAHLGKAVFSEDSTFRGQSVIAARPSRWRAVRRRRYRSRLERRRVLLAKSRHRGPVSDESVHIPSTNTPVEAMSVIASPPSTQ